MFPAEIRKLAERILAEARSKGLHIATAESCTGGLIAGALTEIPGSSDIVDRGFIVYTNLAKRDLLGVPANLILRYGAVSEEVARAMADGAIAKSQAQISVSCTGIAGPTGATQTKAVGLVHLAAAREGQTTLHAECNFGDAGRAQVRMKSVREALKLLFQLM